jgi:hypothetical protein
MVAETELPYCTVRLLCEGTTVKDAKGATLRAALAEALSVPLVACTESVQFPSVAPEAAVICTTCPPAVREKGDAGEVVTPEGRPESVTVADPSKPFCPCSETVAVAVVPGAREIMEGETLMVKEGGCVMGEEEEPPPPHPDITMLMMMRDGVKVARRIEGLQVTGPRSLRLPPDDSSRYIAPALIRR